MRTWRRRVEMHLLLTRPDAASGDDPLAAALAAKGHRVTPAPLLRVVPTGNMPSFEGAQGVIATSRNGLKALGAGPLPDAVRRLPVYAVGPATTALAQRLGFATVIEGPGTGRELADTIRSKAAAGGGALVHLAGETLAFDLAGALAPDGLRIQTETVYRTEPAATLPDGVADLIEAGTLDGVILMSPRTGMVYAALVARAGLRPAVATVRHFCLSAAVAGELVPLGDVPVAVARAPNSQEMLALIAREAPDSP